MSNGSPAEKPPVPTATPNATVKPAAGKGCVGCAGLMGLFVLVFWLADYAGCAWTKSGTDTDAYRKSPRDPTVRYVGPGGAVAGFDNYGRTTRLPPGTAVRATNTSYADPMNGPTRVYIVIEGDLRGMQVPLSEHDLEPQ
jgi:hypothetical protein